MKHSSRLLALAPAALLAVTLAGTTSPAFARKKLAINQLQIWPARRALIVLPLHVAPEFLTQSAPAKGGKTASPRPIAARVDASAPLTAAPDGGMMAGIPTSGSNELATALVPLVSGGLSRALQNTGKFSLISPYKFDPILRRALAESQISDDDLSTFIFTPTLESAQAVLPKLSLDQPGMVARVNLENLQVGGTSAAPTAQVRMRAELFEVPLQIVPPSAPVTGTTTLSTDTTTPAPVAGTDAAPADTTTPATPAAPTAAPPPVPAQLFRSITVTSKAYVGKTPEDRLRAATSDAFDQIAAAFVQPPDEFSLPAPLAPPAAMGAKMGKSSPTSPKK